MNNYSIDSFEPTQIVYRPTKGGESIDLRPFLLELKLRESIDDLFITGSIKIRIPKGFLPEFNAFPTSQDSISINLKSIYKIPTKKIPPTTGDGSITPTTNRENVKPSNKSKDGEEIQGSFFVHNIKSNRSIDFIHDEMVLEFISAEGVKDKLKKVSKAYSKKKRTEIIKQIYSDYLETNSSLEGNPESEHEFSCVIPNWSPSKSIHWLMSGCYKDKEKNFLMYQRFKNGRIQTRFDTFSELAKSDIIIGNENDASSGFIEKIDVPPSLDEEESEDVRLRSVTGTTTIQRVNALEKNVVGTWASKAFFYDITRKKYLRGKKVNQGKGEFSYKDDAEDPQIDSTYEKFILNDDLNEKDSFVALLPKNQYLFHDDEEKSGVDRREEWFLEHRSQKSLNSFYTLQITSIGDTSVSIGNRVTYANSKGVDFKNEDEPLKQKLDDDKKEFGGTYILWSIERVFDFPRAKEGYNGECKNIMTLVRDGWSE